MTDDPWRKTDPAGPPAQPDPYAPPPPAAPPYGVPPAYAPPGYPPAPHYGQPPYGPPGSPPYNPYYAYNPYQGPLPKRGGFGRLLWILCTLGVLVLGGCGVGIYFLAQQVTQNADEVNAFLRNMRDQQYSAAYQHLCPSVRAGLPVTNFTTLAQGAATRGHGVSSYDITASSTSAVTGSGTIRTASGRVSYRDGTSSLVTFTLDKPSGHLCIATGYNEIF
jgi:hypothetical protein